MILRLSQSGEFENFGNGYPACAAKTIPAALRRLRLYIDPHLLRHYLSSLIPRSRNSLSRCTSSQTRLFTSEFFPLNSISGRMTKTLNSIGCVFSHSWTHVVIGMWHKYPHPHCSHVQTIDTVDRSVDPKTGIIRTERIVGCKQKAPMWIVKVCFTRPLPTLLAHAFPYSSLAVQKMPS